MKTSHVVASILLICLLTPISIAAKDNSSQEIEHTDPNATPLISIGNSPPAELFIDPNGLVSSLAIYSTNNQNSKYTAVIYVNAPYTGRFPSVTLICRGRLIRANSWDVSDPGWRAYFRLDQRAAQALSTDLNIPLINKTHPGHKLLTRFIQDENNLNLLTLEITNIGEISIVFYNGGLNRGARNNQFQFIAFRDGEPLPDIGDPLHFGGMAFPVTLKPGDKFTKEVDLTKWFDLSQPGRYSITGLFGLGIIPAPTQGRFLPGDHNKPAWADYAVANLYFRKRPPKTPSP